MNGMIRYEEPSSEEILRMAVEEAESEMISSYSDAEEDAMNAAKIEEFYLTNMRLRGHIPCLEDIMEDVYGHNSACVWQIASVQYEVEGWHGPQKHGETEDDMEDSREETINMLSENWEQYYSDHLYTNLEYYVEGILEELELSYTYEEVHDQFSVLDFENSQKISIVLNDCQNILFPEFMMGADLDCERPGVDRMLFIVSK